MSAVPDPTRYTPCFHYRGGQLHAEAAPLEIIAEKFGTPAYVYSGKAIESAWRRFDRALAGVPHTVCYSVKANSNLSILRLLAKLGSGFDIVSGGELYRLRRIGVAGDRIVFSGVGKTSEEIREALRCGIRLFNVESEEELEAVAREAARLRCVAPCALRVNPDVGAGGHPHISTGRRIHKFGVDWERALEVYRAGLGLRSVCWQGVAAHIGSQVLSLAPFLRALERLGGLVGQLRGAGVVVNWLDIGGGLGVRYTEERPPDVRAYGKVVAAAAKRLRCHLLIEPGRAIVGPAGILLTRVQYRKTNHGRSFVVVDAAMNDLIRPALYGARHPITAVRRPRPGASAIRAEIVGPVCETGDSFLSDWPLPADVQSGDLLAIWSAGAYGFVQSSNYNSRRRVAEVLVEGGRAFLVRKRESQADLIRGE